MRRCATSGGRTSTMNPVSCRLHVELVHRATSAPMRTTVRRHLLRIHEVFVRGEEEHVTTPLAFQPALRADEGAAPVGWGR